MECFPLYSPNNPPFPISAFPTALFPAPVKPFSSSRPSLFPSLSTFSFKTNCTRRPEPEGELHLSAASASAVLGVAPGCSSAELKAAFRSKVKQFHPDVRRKHRGDSDVVIRHVIHAYEFLSNIRRSEIVESCQEFFDPFEDPECEAFDIFVNEVLCVGKGCPYSCVKRASHAFTYASSTGTARARGQGHGEDYQVQLAVGQCPRSCIYYVTPSQRVILEELLDSIMNVPYDTTAETDLLYSLVVKARFENNRYRKPMKQPKASSTHVDWL